MVGIISATDIYLSIRLQDILIQMELNPVGQWLITLDGGSVALFMAVKMVGILLAFMITLVILSISRLHGLLVVSGLLLFHFLLLFVLLS